MKKVFFSAIYLSLTFLAACSSDEESNICRTCQSDLLGTRTTTEYCDNGDGTLTATTNGLEQIIQIPQEITFVGYINSLEAAGAACN